MTDNKYSVTEYTIPGVGQAFEQQYSSPFPAPSILKEYEALNPGSSIQILQTAQNQIAHRQEMEKQAMRIKELTAKQESSIILRGQLFSFILVALGLILGFCLIREGRSVEGFVAILTGIAVIVGSLMLQKSSQEKQKANKSISNI